MKIILSQSVVGNDENIVDCVRADLRDTGARFDCRQLDRHRTMFEHIAWDDIGVGRDRSWNLGVVVDSRDQTVQVWARGMDAIPETMRDQVEARLRIANGWTNHGVFTLNKDSGVIEYIWPPMRYDDLPYGIKGAMEIVDDLLTKLSTPTFRRLAGMPDIQPGRVVEPARHRQSTASLEAA